MLHPIENRQTLLDNRLGSVLTLERDSLAMFEQLEQASKSSDIQLLFSRQSAEAREHIEVLEGLIRTLRIEQSEVPAPTTSGLRDEATSMIDQSRDDAVDMAVLTTALTAEHLAVDAYRTLVAVSASLGFAGVSAILARSLLQQEQLGEELEDALRSELKAREDATRMADFDEWEHSGAASMAAIVDDGQVDVDESPTA